MEYEERQVCEIRSSQVRQLRSGRIRSGQGQSKGGREDVRDGIERE